MSCVSFSRWSRSQDCIVYSLINGRCVGCWLFLIAATHPGADYYFVFPTETLMLPLSHHLNTLNMKSLMAIKATKSNLIYSSYCQRKFVFTSNWVSTQCTIADVKFGWPMNILTLENVQDISHITDQVTAIHSFKKCNTAKEPWNDEALKKNCLH